MQHEGAARVGEGAVADRAAAAQRDAGEPRADAWTRLKRLGRYLLKAPRYILVFRWQKPTSKIKVTVDASHAGCVRTRKSTTCVVVRLGNHMIQDLSETQGTIRLSSGEAEYAGLVRGSQDGLYVKNLLRFFGRSAEVELETDIIDSQIIASGRLLLGLGIHASWAELGFEAAIPMSDEDTNIPSYTTRIGLQF